MHLDPDQIAALEEWLADRPPIIRELAYKYPPGTRFQRDGGIYWLVSYMEDGGIGVSQINPVDDYEGAVATKQEVCASCLENFHLTN